MKNPRIVIEMEGGLIQSIKTDAPVDVLVIDYDRLENDEEEKIREIVTWEGHSAEIYKTNHKADVAPDYVEHYFRQLAGEEDDYDN